MSDFIQEQDTFYACGTPVIIRENDKGETHVYGVDGTQLSTENMKFGTVYGGGKEVETEKTDVTMESGFLNILCGGSENGKVGKAKVTLKGGTVGGYLYGAGVNDTVESVEISVSGGVIKRGFFAAGEALECGDVTLKFDNIISTKVFTGTKNELGVQKGNIKMTMADGIILNVLVGGSGTSFGDADITVSGGLIEKQFATKNHEGKVKLHLYDKIELYNALDKPFPYIEEGMEVDYFTSDYSWDFIKYKEHKQDVAPLESDKGKLVMRFFEVRNPEVPKYTALLSHFIGDCILIDFPNGQHMLVDTGMPYAYEQLKKDFEQLSITKLDYLVLTHAHIDHLGSAGDIMRDYEVGEVILPHVKPTVPDGGNKNAYLDTLETIIDKNIKVRKVYRGESFMVGECEILVLNPTAPYTVAPDINAESIAIKVTYKDTSAVLGGDITDGNEKAIAREYGDKLKTDILKLSHHGITGQTYYEYVDACAPQYVVVHNLREQGVFMRTTRYALNNVHHIGDERIFVTGIHGTIKAVLDGKKGGVKITTEYE